MPEEFLRIGIDSSAARTGAAQYARSVDQIARDSRRAGRQVTQLERGFGGLSRRIQGMRGIASGLFVGLGAAFAVRTISEFGRTMSSVRAITGATGVEFAALETTARQLGATTVFSASQAAEGLRFLAMAGLDAREAMQALPATLNLAMAGAIDLGTAADLASNIMTQFQQSATDVEHITDVLAKTASSTNTSILQLGEAMKFAGPVASAAGISLESTAAALGALGDAGIQASLAGTNLRRILAQLSAPTSEAAGTFDRLGLTMSDVALTSDNLFDVMARLGERNLSVADAANIFGVRVAGAAIILSRSAVEAREFSEELKKLGPEAQKMADIMADNLASDAISLNSAVHELTLAIGEAGLERALRNTIQISTDVVRVWAGMADQTRNNRDEMERLAGSIAAIAGGLTALVTARAVLPRILAAFTAIEMAAGVAAVRTNLLARSVQAVGAGSAVTAVAGSIRGVSVAATAAAGSVGLLTRGLAFFSGPIGLAIAGVTAAIWAYKAAVDDSSDATESLADQLNQFHDRTDVRVASGMEEALSADKRILKEREELLKGAVSRFQELSRQFSLPEESFQREIARELKIDFDVVSNVAASQGMIEIRERMAELREEWSSLFDAIQKATAGQSFFDALQTKVAKDTSLRDKVKAEEEAYKKQQAALATVRQQVEASGLSMALWGKLQDGASVAALSFADTLAGVTQEQRQFAQVQEVMNRLLSLSPEILSAAGLDAEKLAQVYANAKVEFTGLGDAVKFWNQTMADAQTPTESARAAIEVLGIAAKATSQSETDLQLAIDTVMRSFGLMAPAVDQNVLAQSEFQRLLAASITPAERYANLLNLLENHLDRTGKSQDEVNRAMAQAKLEFENASKSQGELGQVSQQTQNILANGFTSAIFSAQSFDQVLKSILLDLAQMAVRFAVINALSGVFGKGGLLGLQHGGDFKVSGAGATDSKVVAFRATPGETVHVRTPEQRQQENILQTQLSPLPSLIPSLPQSDIHVPRPVSLPSPRVAQAATTAGSRDPRSATPRGEGGATEVKVSVENHTDARQRIETDVEDNGRGEIVIRNTVIDVVGQDFRFRGPHARMTDPNAVNRRRSVMR